jgi:putative hydrolase of the HAD superfamily
MPVEAILFDLFDTLLLLESSEVYYTPCLKKLYKFLTRNGIRVPFEDFRRVYFEIRDRFYSESRQTLEEPHFNVRVSQTLQQFGYNLDICDPIVTGATMAFADEFMHYVHLDNEATEVLQNLKRRYKLGVVSNFAIPECGLKLLNKFGLRGFFDIVVISGEVNRRKPSAEIFEKALKALNVNAAQTIFVGDMLDLDIKGPKNVGMKTVLIQRKPVEAVSDANPDWIIKRLDELLPLLNTVE